jgi:hypothetical protein
MTPPLARDECAGNAPPPRRDSKTAKQAARADEIMFAEYSSCMQRALDKIHTQQ